MKKQAFNPYLPDWEYVPDGEPHVFDDRVYVYGSHDRFGAPIFCVNDYVCWSAPLDDLSDWRYEGVIYKKKQDPSNKTGLRCLYAPDAAILSYPVITTGQYTHQGSIMALLGVRYDLDANGLVCAASEAELAYMSLEKQVTPDTPPCFIWQTAEDEAVPVENSYLFAQACKAQGVPFAHHVFSKGRHGLSLANEVWASGQFGEPYTMEQTMALVNAVRDRQIPLPEETREGILKQFDFSDPNEMFKNMYVNPEVRIWPELAKQWLEEIL